MPIQRTGLLIVRAWLEPGSATPLRARIQVTDDISDGVRSLVVSGPEAVDRVVGQWLLDLMDLC